MPTTHRPQKVLLLATLVLALVTTSMVYYRKMADEKPLTPEQKITSARRLARAGLFNEAIQTDKAIAADTANSPIVRAYAVADMARQHTVSLDASSTPEIFKDEPYRSLYVQGDAELSYRKLFDYASSIYPLGISLGYSANWYADQIVELSGARTSSAETKAQIQSYDAKIKELLAAVDTDLGRLKTAEPSETVLIPQIMLRKAVVLGKLARVGLASPTDAEAAFKEVLSSYKTYNPAPGADGAAYYNYAKFVHYQFGKKRVADVKDLLKPIYSDSSYMGYIGILFRNIRISGTPRAKSDLTDLASVDPNFKAFLMTLGWTAADFK